MLRILVTLGLVVAAAPTLAGETLRIGSQTTGTFAWQLDVIRRHRLADGACRLRITKAPGRVSVPLVVEVYANDL